MSLPTDVSGDIVGFLWKPEKVESKVKSVMPPMLLKRNRRDQSCKNKRYFSPIDYLFRN